MQIDDFLGLVKRRRSVRRFRSDPVPDAHIQKMLEAVRWAMSGANAQPWEFVVVRDKGTRLKIVGAYDEACREVYAIEQTRITELRHPQFRALEGSPGWAKAPVIIAVLGDRRTYQATVLAAHFLGGEGGSDATYLKSLANATQNLHLAAAALRLGSQWISVSFIWGQAIKRILDVPEILELHSLVAVGYPAYEPPAPYRRRFGEIVHYERYDRSRYRSGEDIVKYLRLLRRKTEPAYKSGLSSKRT